MNKEELKKDVLYFDMQEGKVLKFTGFDEVGRARFEEVVSGLLRIRPHSKIVELEGKHIKVLMESMIDIIDMHARIQHKVCEQLDEKEKMDYIKAMHSLGKTLSLFQKD